MAQTKFVLSKALAAQKKAIVVLNKVDRENHRADEVESEIFDLFCTISSNESLLDYPLLYASAKNGQFLFMWQILAILLFIFFIILLGWVTETLASIPGKNGVVPLLDMIVKHIPSPNVKLTGSFALTVNTISTDNHLGRIVTGKVESGTIRMGDKIKILTREGKEISSNFKVTKLFYLKGLTKVSIFICVSKY